ncbi:HpcH/HpaI aldolase family protein [Bradyrhizobium sp. SYSU BS000235]|uniref:HpcH/HpaI aldolase family protein n=1 Tax=Bradyrhizobium sp. SYSU BS000235 TaxID=3411332 RepID=UPI003C78EB90
MEMPRNRFKSAIKQGKLQIGLWNSLCSPFATDVIADSGFDWILLDTEHAPNEIPNVLGQLQALSTSTATPIVRPAWNDTVLLKRVLDIGAQAVLVPFVQNAEEAKRAVAACQYPPSGVRGVTGSGRASRFGRVKDYLKHANDEICVLVQVETSEAISHLEEIAAVPGIDGIFVGPADLAASMGHIGNSAHPDVQAAIQDVVTRLKKVGKPAGILTPNEAEADRYIDWGYTFVAVGSDLGLLSKNADALAKRFAAAKKG